MGNNTPEMMKVKIEGNLNVVFLLLSFGSKHLECERDELRNQVEELCKMRTAAEEYVQ